MNRCERSSQRKLCQNGKSVQHVLLVYVGKCPHISNWRWFAEIITTLTKGVRWCVVALSSVLLLRVFPSLSTLQSMSGIEVDAEIPTLFNEIKLRATHKWVTFRIENKKKVVVDQKGDPCSTTDKETDKGCFGELAAVLGDEPRYILYDFGFTNKEHRKIGKLAFIFW